MSTCDAIPSYYALRARRDASTAAWWSAARAGRGGAPDAARALLAGRDRVELTAGEVRVVLEWARGLDGWRDDEGAALGVWPPLACAQAPDDDEGAGDPVR